MARTMSSSSHRFLFFSFVFVFAGLAGLVGDVGAIGVVGDVGVEVVAVSFGVDGEV